MTYCNGCGHPEGDHKRVLDVSGQVVLFCPDTTFQPGEPES
jgi:hypothetical protein